MNRAFIGIWIPKEIWLQKDISIQEKCLWAEIQSLSNNDDGVCYASNEYLMEFLGVKERRLQEMLAHLKDLGLIVYVNFDGRQRSMKAVTPKVCAPQRCGKVHPRGAEKCTSEMQKSAPSPYIENKEENKDKNIAQTARSAAQPRSTKVPDITFSFANNNFENINDKDITTWAQLYPAVNIQRELLDMIEWIRANPSKAKSKKHWRQFIRGWLQRQNEKLTNRMAYQSAKENKVISRHTGFQKDNRPVHPSRTIDLSEYEESTCT